MTLEQKLDLLLSKEIVHTQFATIAIPASGVGKGVPLGDGKCRAVQLYVNSLVLNTTAAVAVAANLRQIYYGDQRGQFRELLTGQISDLIFCEDLSQVYVRGNGIATNVQVTIYLGKDDPRDFTIHNQPTHL